MAVAALLVALTCVVTGVLGTALLRGYLLARSDSQLRDFTQVANQMFAHGRPPTGGGSGQQLPIEFPVEVVSADGAVELTRGALQRSPGPALTPGLLKDHGTPFTVPGAGGGAGAWRVLIEPLSGGRYLVAAYSLDDLDSTVTRLEAADGIAGAIAVGLLAVIGLPLVRRSLKPLDRIEETAVAIAGGDLSRRIDHPPAGTEVGRLAVALNTMLGTIEAAYRARAQGEERALRSEDRMRQFVADASHELRTPLTSVRGLAEYGLQMGDAASREELLRLLSRIGRESARMGRLVEDLLLLAKFDAGRPLDRHPVDLASIAAEAVAAIRVTSPGRQVSLVAPEPVIIDADEGRLRQVIDNLLANAVSHTPDDAQVTVTVTPDPDAPRGEVTVADDGPGLTGEQAARVFERFYRTDGSRARAGGGAGLGLAIVASLVAAHDGEITVDTAPGRGAAFHVRLPLAMAPDHVGATTAGSLRRPAGHRAGLRPASPARSNRDRRLYTTLDRLAYGA
jgi:two-component system OmpR family sensor kinase